MVDDEDERKRFEVKFRWIDEMEVCFFFGKIHNNIF